MDTAAGAYGYSVFSAFFGSGGAKKESTATQPPEKDNKGIAHSTIRRVTPGIPATWPREGRKIISKMNMNVKKGDAIQVEVSAYDQTSVKRYRADADGIVKEFFNEGTAYWFPDSAEADAPETHKLQWGEEFMSGPKVVPI